MKWLKVLDEWLERTDPIELAILSGMVGIVLAALVITLLGSEV